MKRFVVVTGLLMGIAILAALGCGLFPGVNKIQYPVSYYYYENPGDSITLSVYVLFYDQTPDTSGVLFNADQSNDTIWIQVREDYGTEEQGSFSNLFYKDVGVVESGNYKMVLIGKEGLREGFDLTVTDSSYELDGGAGEVGGGAGEVGEFWGEVVLRRLFADMLLVEIGLVEGENADAFITSLGDVGATSLTLAEGHYSIFEIADGDVDGNREVSETWLIYGNFTSTQSLIYTFAGDTALLDSVYTEFEGDISALSIRSGNGFDRYNWE